MGEAVYSMVAEWPKAIDEKTQKAVRKFFLEGSRAEDWWQDHRDRTPEQFWPEFRKKFPTVTKYLARVKDYNNTAILDGDNNNGLAGNLDFGSAKDIVNQLRFKDRRMTYSAEIWHMATWKPLERFLRNKLGATTILWGSEEEGKNVDSLILTLRTQRLEAENKRLKAKLKRKPNGKKKTR